ncbi:MAG: D-alanyl-D-alanine carboxypeptidase [Firmicutes bacterium]|nr:D-alanyl-D-alanine carboxypeptidase [Bacillota bacterium]
MKKILFTIIMCMTLNFNANAMENLAPNSKSAILLETSTGKVLFENNSDEKLAPASMTKIMSMLLIMEKIDKEKISFEDDVKISQNAADMGGSQIFLEAGETYKVKDLLKGIAVASGNDAVVAMAEYTAGSVDEFVKMMNDKAKQLGLKNTVFKNPHGLDTEGHYSTARDMATIALELLKHERILEFTSIYEDYLKKNDGSSTWLVNTNKLVRFYDGVDGLKTGFTSTAKYCVTTTAKKKNMRLLSVVMGVDTSDLRSKDTTNMLNYGFNNYKIEMVMPKDKILGNVKVLKGKDNNVNLVLLKDSTILKKINEKEEDYTVKIKIKEVEAPVKKGQVVGKAEIVDKEGKIISEEDVTVTKDIKKADFFDYVKKNYKTITMGI